MKYKLNLGATIPLIIFLLIGLVLFQGLHLHPEKISSPLIKQKTPKFLLPDLFNPNIKSSNKMFLNHITILNVWASWCENCLTEHLLLKNIAQDKKINLVGINYRDNINQAKKWLKQFGNPYKQVFADTTGKTAIDWGIYGTPETFVIDKKGIIQYKQIGAIDIATWQNVLKPLVHKLETAS